VYTPQAPEDDPDNGKNQFIKEKTI